MANNWRRMKLGDCFDLIGGYAFKSEDFLNDGIPVIKIKNVKANQMLFDNLSYVEPAFASKRPEKVAINGDLLITMSGNRLGGSPDTWVGKVAQFREKTIYIVNQRVGILRPKNGMQLNRRYFSYALSSEFYQNEFIAIATSSGGQANLSPSQILAAPIDVPPIAIQRAIAHILGTLDDKIELNRRMNATLESMARALFQSWFVDFDPVRAKMDGRKPAGMDAETAALFPDSFVESELGLIPKGWGIGSLLEDVEFLSGGTPKTNISNYWDGEIPWASAKDVSQCGETFLISTERRITQLGLNESSTKLIPAFATVVVSRGATTGRLTMFASTMAMNQTCYALSSKSNCPFSLYCHARNAIEGIVNAGHGSIFNTITTSTFQACKVLLLPLALSREFDIQSDPLFRQILVNLKVSTSLATLRDTLLPKLLSGELSVKHAEKLVGEAT